MKYYSSKIVTQILWVIAQTLRNWDREGKLKPYVAFFFFKPFLLVSTEKYQFGQKEKPLFW